MAIENILIKKFLAELGSALSNPSLYAATSSNKLTIDFNHSCLSHLNAETQGKIFRAINYASEQALAKTASIIERKPQKIKTILESYLLGLSHKTNDDNALELISERATIKASNIKIASVFENHSGTLGFFAGLTFFTGLAAAAGLFNDKGGSLSKGPTPS
jgi:hypothetical protein